ncbi:protein dj-1beta-like [Bolinopsis microptera]|uniref:protein dj-1beta-like n=1 Tax=Bolinopsis microptera TaxID=2820187 RepID=UPI003078C637
MTSTKRALVCIAPGFEEVEFTVPVDILRRGGVDVKIATILDDMSPVPGRCGIKISPECLISEITEDDLYDLVFVPGGLAAAEAFAASPTVGDIYTRHNNQNKFVAAICASPIAFNKHKINHGRRITCYPALAIRLDGNYKYCSDSVVVDGNMITSRGPGTAFDYGMELLEQLKGKDTRDQIAKDMLYTL